VAYQIKRYSNRKLYDPHTSRYVTLDDLRALIRGGTEIEVRDAATGEDLTSLTLTQILLEGEKTHRDSLPAVALHQLIKYGDAWLEFLQQSLRANPMLAAGQREAERFFRQWAPPGAAARSEERPTEPVPASGAGSEPDAGHESAKELREELAALKQRLKEVEKRIPSKRPRKSRG
jgi:polyhydroxyalkanoate synthesis repressor PhaR